jgi:Fe-S-cluster containining protein
LTSVKAHVDLKIAGQPKRVEFNLPDGPVRPADLLPVFRQFSNAMVEAAEAAATEPISCAKGCGACCRQLVPVREMEARRLASFVQALPAPRRSMILERFAAAARRLEATGMRERLDSRGGLDQPGRVTLKLDYFTLGIACPFLDEESCGIYAERPMICREHLVTTPAAWCANPREGKIKTLPIRRADSAVARLEAPADRADWVPLIDILTWVEAHPVDQAEKRDPRELVQQFVGDLAG